MLIPMETVSWIVWKNVSKIPTKRSPAPADAALPMSMKMVIPCQIVWKKTWIFALKTLIRLCPASADAVSLMKIKMATELMPVTKPVMMILKKHLKGHAVAAFLMSIPTAMVRLTVWKPVPQIRTKQRPVSAAADMQTKVPMLPMTMVMTPSIVLIYAPIIRSRQIPVRAIARGKIRTAIWSKIKMTDVSIIPRLRNPAKTAIMSKIQTAAMCLKFGQLQT